MTVPETVLDRLNYFNGQRLEATDFRAEQAYHMAVRRALNRALYSPGIGNGLEVRKHPTDKHRVTVLPGLAIDAQGREIILLEARDVLARGSPAGGGGLVLGNYLVVSYYEAKAGSTEDGCRVDAGASLCGTLKSHCSCGGSGNAKSKSGKGGCGCGGSSGRGGDPADTGLAWGGMSRIRAEPILEFQNAWPSKGSGKIVLAQLRVNAQCQVVDVLTGMRQYTSGTRAPKVRALSLEGEKDIDHANPKVLFFQVEGANPHAVTIHLWATRFSTLYYTELGKHQHVVTGTTDKFDHDFVHNHNITNGHTDGAGNHNHNYNCDDTSRDLRVFKMEKNPGTPFLYDSAFHSGDQAAGFSGEPSIWPIGDHTHNLHLDNALGLVSHTHVVTNGLAKDAGVTTLSARDAQPPLSFLNAMKVELDGTNITPLILAHLEGLSPGDWASLGDGTATHALASSKGSGGIELKQLGIEFPLGGHKLVFSVPPNAGGQLHYNLYIE